MAIGDLDAVDRAAHLMRAQPEPGWHAIEDAVVTAIRSTPRGGWPLLVEDPQPGSAPGTLLVSDVVLGARLSRALSGDPDYAVTDIEIRSEGTALQGVSIRLSGRYLADLRSAAARAQARCKAVIADVVGNTTGIAINVAVDDVHR
jgi:hypothetical protein